MTTLLRLMAYPPADLTHLAGFTSPAPTPEHPPRISCLLHVVSLPSGHSLEVRVRDTLVPGHSEDEQQVFSWQCAAGEAIRLTLWSHGRPQREWLGCWNGEQALLHAGTLSVQVFFAGQPQPEVDPADLVPLLSPSRHNGHTEENTPGELLVLAQPSPVEELREAASECAEAGGSDEDHEIEEPSAHFDNVIPEERISATIGSEDHSLDETTKAVPTLIETLPTLQAPTGTQLATWHADPTGGDTSLEALTTRLTQMPAKTLLVDLRQHPRQAARFQETDPLSKQALRQTFGARYFDRGWAIRTTQRVPSDQSRARIQCVITNPHDPEGLPLLVDRLRRGYSLLLIDRTATYEESARAAVVATLQQQVGNLTLGTLS